MSAASFTHLVRFVAACGGRRSRHPRPRRIDLISILQRHPRRLPAFSVWSGRSGCPCPRPTTASQRRASDSPSGRRASVATSCSNLTHLNLITVEEYENNGKTQKKWTRIGAAFSHKEGPGFSIELKAFPIDGRLVVLPPDSASQVSILSGVGRRLKFSRRQRSIRHFSTRARSVASRKHNACDFFAWRDGVTVPDVFILT